MKLEGSSEQGIKVGAEELNVLTWLSRRLLRYEALGDALILGTYQAQETMVSTNAWHEREEMTDWSIVKSGDELRRCWPFQPNTAFDGLLWQCHAYLKIPVDRRQEF